MKRVSSCGQPENLGSPILLFPRESGTQLSFSSIEGKCSNKKLARKKDCTNLKGINEEREEKPPKLPRMREVA